jgi:6,7-dimethyl-8-ribityllumazine synthase
VVRGGSPQFEFVSSEAARGIQHVALHHPLPVVSGGSTTDTLEQAQARTGGLEKNEEWEALKAAIEIASELRRVKQNIGRMSAQSER